MENPTPISIQTIAASLGAVRDEIAEATRDPHTRENSAAHAYLNADATSEAAIYTKNSRLQYLQDAEAGLRRMAARLSHQ